MEDKIEVGEYVRTNNKGIKRIDRIDNNKTVNKYLYFTGIEDFEGKEYMRIKTTEIVKHSKQLIDLIEVKDLACFKNKLQNSLENEEMIIHQFCFSSPCIRHQTNEFLSFIFFKEIMYVLLCLYWHIYPSLHFTVLIPVNLYLTSYITLLH